MTVISWKIIGDISWKIIGDIESALGLPGDSSVQDIVDAAKSAKDEVDKNREALANLMREQSCYRGANEKLAAAHNALNRRLVATQVYDDATKTERPMTLAERIEHLATHPSLTCSECHRSLGSTVAHMNCDCPELGLVSDEQGYRPGDVDGAVQTVVRTMAGRPALTVEEARAIAPTATDALRRMKVALSHIQAAASDAAKSVPGGRVLLAIIAKAADGSGQVACDFESTEFFADLETIMSADAHAIRTNGPLPVSAAADRLASGYVQRLRSGVWEWCHDGGFDHGIINLSPGASAWLSAVVDGHQPRFTESQIEALIFMLRARPPIEGDDELLRVLRAMKREARGDDRTEARRTGLGARARDIATGAYNASPLGSKVGRRAADCLSLAEAHRALRSTLESFSGLIPNHAFDTLHAVVRDVENAQLALAEKQPRDTSAHAWNWCPKCKQTVDDDMRTGEFRDGSEGTCIGCGTVYVATDYQDGTWSFEPREEPRTSDASLEARAKQAEDALRRAGVSTIGAGPDIDRGWIAVVRACDASRPTTERTFPRVTLSTVKPGSLVEIASGDLGLVTDGSTERGRRPIAWITTGHVGTMPASATVSLRATPAELDALTSADVSRPGLTEEQAREIVRRAIAEKSKQGMANMRVCIAEHELTCAVTAAILRASRGETGPAPTERLEKMLANSKEKP